MMTSMLGSVPRDRFPDSPNMLAHQHSCETAIRTGRAVGGGFKRSVFVAREGRPRLTGSGTWPRASSRRSLGEPAPRPPPCHRPAVRRPRPAVRRPRPTRARLITTSHRPLAGVGATVKRLPASRRPFRAHASLNGEGPTGFDGPLAPPIAAGPTGSCPPGVEGRTRPPSGTADAAKQKAADRSLRRAGRKSARR